MTDPQAPAPEPIRFSCPNCDRALRVPAAMAGQRMRCSGCQGVITAPTPEPTPAEVTDFMAAPPPPVRNAGDNHEPTVVDYQSATEPPPPPSDDEAMDETVDETMDEAGDDEWAETPGYASAVVPARRPWNPISPLLGIVGAGLVATGAFYSLVVVTRPEFQVQQTTIKVVFEPYWVLPVQIGAVLLALAGVAVGLARLYWGYWVMGLGTLASLAFTYVFFFHVRIREVARESAVWDRRDAAQEKLVEMVVAEATKCFQPGIAFAFYAAGAACWVVAALFARWLNRHFAYR